MPTADTRSSIRVIKQFTYRDTTRTFSNRYHITGPLPTTLTKFTTLADLVVADEAALYDSTVTIIRVDYNDATSASSTNPHGDVVFTKTYSTVGTFTPETGDKRGPGDSAMLLKWSTDARSVKNHPIYLFNYFHGCYLDDNDNDKLSELQLSALNEYGDDWVAGFSDGADTRKRCGPRGAVALNNFGNMYVTHRDLPR